MARFAFLAACSAAVFLSPWPAEACGGGGVTVPSDSTKAGVADSQRIVLAFHADKSTPTTDIIAQIGVPAADADYGVLIPVPGEPKLDPQPVSIADLDALDHYTQPTIVTLQEGWEEENGSGCGCGSSGDDDAAGSKGSDGSSSTAVSVSAPVNVGPATAVVLKADDGSALTAWLDENGFAIPSEHQAIVDHYVEMGDSFIAIRRRDTAPPDGPTSLGLHYTLAGDHRQLSLMFARIGAAPTVSFTVFVTAPTIAFPTEDFAPLELQELPESTLRASYSAAVAQAVARYGSHAFVMEGTWGAPLRAPVSDEFAALLGSTNFTTRASTIVAANALDTDVRFDVHGVSVPNSVTLGPASARLPRARESGVGVLSLVLAARALRRRFRRRGNGVPEATPARELR